MSMIDSVIENLKSLENKILNETYISKLDKVKIWGGADVIITDKIKEYQKSWLDSQPLVIDVDFESPDFIPNAHRLVVTKFDRELSWLFYELKDIFKKYINFSTKFQFYGMLAIASQKAINKGLEDSRRDFLLHVLEEGAWKYFSFYEKLFNELEN